MVLVPVLLVSLSALLGNSSEPGFHVSRICHQEQNLKNILNLWWIQILLKLITTITTNKLKPNLHFSKEILEAANPITFLMMFRKG